MYIGRILRRAKAWMLGKNWLFLDDSRKPPEHFCKVFDTVRDFDQFRDWVETYGIPELVSFDHDLNIEHVEYFINSGGFRNPPDPRKVVFCHPTGYECADWFLGKCVEFGEFPKFVVVHSSNPMGSDQIYSLFTGFTEMNNQEIVCRKIRWGVSPRK